MSEPAPGPPPVVALDGLPPTPHVVSVGTFDGVHLGHRHLLRGAVARGRELGLPVAAVTFEPLPPAVLRPDRFAGRICTPAEKLAAIGATGVDAIAVVPFTLAFSRTSPERFMADLAAAARLRELWVGEGFALGKDRAGDVPRLTEIGRGLGFAVVALPRLTLDGETVSSSEVRRALLAGEVRRAWACLGRPHRVEGTVVHGKKVGRTIGFPTANLLPPADLVPLADGIYASWAWLDGDAAPRPAVTYIGRRPTVNTGERAIETHLLDFDGDLYGRHLQVDLLEHLRPDENFPTLDALVAQMGTDRANAQRVHAEVAAAAG